MTSSPPSVTRIANHEYLLTKSDPRYKPVILSYPPGKVPGPADTDPELHYHLAKEIANRLFNSQNGKYTPVKIGERTWHISEKGRMPLSKKLQSGLFPFFYPKGDDSVLRISVEPSLPLTNADLTVNGFLSGRTFTPQVEKAYYANSLRPFAEEKTVSDKAITFEEYDQGIRAKIPLENASFFDLLGKSPFDTPFHALTRLAFQTFEPSLKPQDFVDPDDCATFLFNDNGRLLLVAKDSDAFKDREINQATTRHFLNMMESYFGEEKFLAAQALTKINWEEQIYLGNPLTPEMVYRLTLCLTSIETTDLQQFIEKLPTLKMRLESLPDDYGLENFLCSSQQFSLRELRGLIRVLPKKDLAGLKTFIASFEETKGVETLDPPLFERLYKVFSFKKEEKELAYCGRKIYSEIKSAYTFAGKNEFKPWIDQQELLQIEDSLKRAYTWEAYHELLSVIVVKKHLFRKNPKTGYKTGLILPGPLLNDKKKRFFKVSKALANAYGMLNYTLESACKDDSVPLIIAYRSTSSNKYAFDSKRTVRTDFNRLNTPGREGIGHSDPYEKELFEKSSIPAWYGLAIVLSRKIAKLNDWEVTLYTTIQDLLKDYKEMILEVQAWKQAQVQVKDLPTLIQEYDWLLNDIFLGEVVEGKVPHTEDFSKVYNRIKERYIHLMEDHKRPSVSSDLQKTQKSDALDLIEKLTAYAVYVDDPKKTASFRLFINDLIDHVITQRAIERFHKVMQAFHQEVYSHLTDVAAEVRKLIDRGNYDIAIEKVGLGIDLVEQYAKDQGEHPKDKCFRNIVLTGHSLGGACAQAYLHHFYTSKCRIPLPGTTLSLAAFDAPGVTSRVNTEFKDLVIRNQKIPLEFGPYFKILHQHASCDFVPEVGEHLGSCSSEQEMSRLIPLIEFSGHVYTPTKTAKEKSIAEASIAHGTRFLMGQEGKDYRKTPFTPYDLGLFNRGARMRDLSPKEGRKKGLEVRKKIWKVTQVSPLTAEKIRSSLAQLPFKSWLKERDLNAADYRDDFGVFAVSEFGPLSATPAAQEESKEEWVQYREALVASKRSQPVGQTGKKVTEKLCDKSTFLPTVFSLGGFIFDSFKSLSSSDQIKEIGDEVKICEKQLLDIQERIKSADEEVKEELQKIEENLKVYKKQLKINFNLQVEQEKKKQGITAKSAASRTKSLNEFVSNLVKKGTPLSQITSFLDFGITPLAEGLEVSKTMKAFSKGREIDALIYEEIEAIYELYALLPQPHPAREVLELRLNNLMFQSQWNTIKTAQAALGLVQSGVAVAISVKTLATLTGVTLGKGALALYSVLGPAGIAVSLLALVIEEGYYLFKNREYVLNQICLEVYNVQYQFFKRSLDNKEKQLHSHQKEAEYSQELGRIYRKLSYDPSQHEEEQATHQVKAVSLQSLEEKHKSKVPSLSESAKKLKGRCEHITSKITTRKDKVSINQFTGCFLENITTESLKEFRLNFAKLPKDIIYTTLKSLGPSYGAQKYLLTLKNRGVDEESAFHSILNWITLPVNE